MESLSIRRKFMKHPALIVFDIVCITVLSVHLTDLDTALKIVASLAIIATNIVVLFKKFKN